VTEGISLILLFVMGLKRTICVGFEIVAKLCIMGRVIQLFGAREIGGERENVLCRIDETA